MFADEQMGLPIGLNGNDNFFKQASFLKLLNIALIYALSEVYVPNNEKTR